MVDVNSAGGRGQRVGLLGRTAVLTQDRLTQTRRLRVAGVPDPALDAWHQVRPVQAPGPIQRQEPAVVPLAEHRNPCDRAFGHTLERRSFAEECDTQGAKQHDGREEVRRHCDVFEPIPVCSKGVSGSCKPVEHSARERCA